MTHHPIAQIASNGNLKSQENRHLAAVLLRNRLLHPPRFAARLDVSAILHGRPRNGASFHVRGHPPREERITALLKPEADDRLGPFAVGFSSALVAQHHPSSHLSPALQVAERRARL